MKTLTKPELNQTDIDILTRAWAAGLPLTPENAEAVGAWARWCRGPETERAARGPQGRGEQAWFALREAERRGAALPSVYGERWFNYGSRETDVRNTAWGLRSPNTGCLRGVTSCDIS